MDEEKENKKTTWMRFRPLTRKEKKRIKRLQVSEETKQFIAEQWSQRGTEEVSKNKLQWFVPVFVILGWIFSFVLFVSFFDNGNMFDLDFDYYSNLVMPLERILSFVFFVIIGLAFLILIVLRIHLTINKEEVEEEIAKDISKFWWRYLLDSSLLQKIHDYLFSLALFLLTIITGHMWIAGFILASSFLMTSVKKGVKNIYSRCSA